MINKNMNPTTFFWGVSFFILLIVGGLGGLIFAFILLLLRTASNMGRFGGELKAILGSTISKELLSWNRRIFISQTRFLRIFFFILITNWGGLIPFINHTFLTKIRISILLISSFFWIFSYLPFFFYGKENFTRFTIGEMKFPPLSFLLRNIEVLTHLFRPITLSARLWVNIWVGHLILRAISFYRLGVLGGSLGGILAILRGAGFFLFEVGIIFLQTFVFTYLSKVYFEENLEHRW